MEIRIMTIEDYEAAMELWCGASGVGISPDDTQENLAIYLARNPKTSFVAIENGELVGAVMAGHDGYRGFIHHTAVRADYARRKIGTALCEAVLEALRSEGIHKAMLVVKVGNDVGSAFWEARGFSAREDLIYRNRRIDE